MTASAGHETRGWPGQREATESDLDWRDNIETAAGTDVRSGRETAACSVAYACVGVWESSEMG